MKERSQPVIADLMPSSIPGTPRPMPKDDGMESSEDGWYRYRETRKNEEEDAPINEKERIARALAG